VEADRPDAKTLAGQARHLAGFVASGAIAAATDMTILAVGSRLLGFDPRLTRLLGIAVAIVVAWLCHRRLTFAVTARPNLAEFLAFAAAAVTTAALNYALFLLALFVWQGLAPELALVVSTAFATIFAYVSMRWGVFRGSGR
jgi:putative flippase GtrA